MINSWNSATELLIVMWQAIHSPQWTKDESWNMKLNVCKAYDSTDQESWNSVSIIHDCSHCSMNHLFREKGNAVYISHRWSTSSGRSVKHILIQYTEPKTASCCYQTLHSASDARSVSNPHNFDRHRLSKAAHLLRMAPSIGDHRSFIKLPSRDVDVIWNLTSMRHGTSAGLAVLG